MARSLDGKVLMRLFFEGDEYRVKIFRGTPREELADFIKEHLRIPMKNTLTLVDEEGDPTMLTSYIGDGQKLHVVQQHNVNKKRRREEEEEEDSDTDYLEEVQQTIERPLELMEPYERADWRRFMLCSGGTIEDDGKSWTGVIKREGCHAMSPPFPLQGKHYVVIDFSHTYCCLSVGLVDARVMDVPRFCGDEDQVSFPHMMALVGLRRRKSPGEKDFVRPFDCHMRGVEGFKDDEPYTVGMLIDMDDKKVYFLNHKERPVQPRKVIRLDNLPHQVRFMINATPKHGVVAKFHPDQTQAPRFNKNNCRVYQKSPPASSTSRSS